MRFHPCGGAKIDTKSWRPESEPLLEDLVWVPKHGQAGAAEEGDRIGRLGLETSGLGMASHRRGPPAIGALLSQLFWGRVPFLTPLFWLWAPLK